ncbi:MAG: VWA domain-containing protein [Planctomycetes bacterium]|nr:VWA domain-containing protein [Planctomycetota bacterium]
MGRLLQRLFGLDTPLDAASRARPIFSDPWLPAWVLLALVVLVYLFYRGVYRRDGRRLSRRQVRALYVLRIVLAVGVLLMLLRPAFDILRGERRLPIVALLVDESLSMTLPVEHDNPLLSARDLGGTGVGGTGVPPVAPTGRRPVPPGMPIPARSRYAVAAEAVSRLAEPLTASHRVKLFTFSDKLDLVKDIAYRGATGVGGTGVGGTGVPPVTIREALKAPTGEHTDISDAVVRALDELKGSKVSAIVLVSDGRATDAAGLDPAIRAARERGVAIHTVTCGTEDPLRDLAIENLIAPEEASLNDVMAVRVAIVNHIRPNLTVELKVVEEGQPVAAQELTLAWGRNHRVVTAIPKVKGERKFRLELPEFPDELTHENNRKEFSVNVVERELRVLFVAGAPSIEYHFIMQSLSRDPIINVSGWLQGADINYAQPGDTPVERLPRTLRDWEEYHVAVLYDVDPNLLSNEQETALEAMVRGGGGLLFVAGRTHGMDKLLQVRGARMRALLPVEIDKDRRSDHEEVFEAAFRAERTEAGRKHPIFRFEMDDKANGEVWATLPTFHWHHPVLAAKPTAVSLLERVGGEGGTGVPPVDRGKVLMALQRYEKGVVFYTGLQTLWRWRYPYENYDYDRFWRQLVRYLSEAKLLGTQKQVALYTDKAAYSPGENVQISLAVLDPALLNQLRQEAIAATVIEESGAELRVPMRPVSGEGLSEYRADYRARRVGRYKVNVQHALARGSSDRKPLFNESRPFSVELQSLEFVNATADPQTMAKLAAETGGKAFARQSLRDVASLADEVPKEPQLVAHQTIEDFWDSPLFLLAFLAIIGTEWVLRKQWELI